MPTRDNSCPFVVEKSEVVLVKPSKPTPDVTLSLSTIDNDPNNEVILDILCVFAPNPYVQDHADYHPASFIQLALSNALVYYYPLAGKLHRLTSDQTLQLDCTEGDGVPLIKATASCSLSSLNYLESGDHLDATYQLVPSHDTLKGCNLGYRPLALQVTKFTCGGMTIGLVHSHTVCDGIGLAQFSQAILELAAGKAQPTVIPVWDRDRLTSNQISSPCKLGNDKKDPKLVDLEKACSSPDTPTEDMVREILNITSEDITKLKNISIEDENLANENEKNMEITTVEALAAYVWRARCRAMKLDPDTITDLVISVGIRSSMEPPLPEGYYGNAFTYASVALTAEELSKTPMSRLVRLIKDAKREALDNGYVWEKLREMENTMKLKLASEEIHGGVFMMLTDWRHLGLDQEVWGGLMNIIPLVPLTLPFMCVLLPASKAVPGKSGGVRVLTTLPRYAMAKFKEEMDALHR
ncbi:unnamed protein product [Arabidopsis lyrata]|uniref:Predicted protein n=1 Tax=Arabidopsis lyrata subsp. lyrata TaxID=81972 RepID=D7LNB3_ARALL|nr:spermidine sinapoyl-CoA acyltransferase [Arabidopsis lyrata subsp. lyrata]EFH53809.1 predicted protein [Arabidopsis lyrata subsp. lyrata]CAH8267746.1 unnamed protein product [Arabidopsis lyrata]|eukprot:XP_002877550.1 spermidine sinapoyl-CoA acyltransferase [Arabidopsis lyrata subsp. lyrata]